MVNEEGDVANWLWEQGKGSLELCYTMSVVHGSVQTNLVIYTFLPHTAAIHNAPNATNNLTNSPW